MGHSTVTVNVKSIRVDMEVVAAASGDVDYPTAIPRSQRDKPFSIQVDTTMSSNPSPDTAQPALPELSAAASAMVTAATASPTASGSHDALVISMPHVYYTHLYRNRSFVITNHCATTLEFTLSSDLDNTTPTELYFSLSNTTLKLFTYLYVDPGASVRVFLHFLPMMNERTLKALADTRSRIRAREIAVQSPHLSSTSESGAMLPPDTELPGMLEFASFVPADAAKPHAEIGRVSRPKTPVTGPLLEQLSTSNLSQLSPLTTTVASVAAPASVTRAHAKSLSREAVVSPPPPPSLSQSEAGNAVPAAGGLSSAVFDSENDFCEFMHVQVHVSCQLIRESRKTVLLRAKCFAPQMQLSASELVFLGDNALSAFDANPRVTSDGSLSGAEQSGASPAVSTGAYQAVIVRNTYLSNLVLALRNDSNYFIISDGGLSIDSSLTTGDQWASAGDSKSRSSAVVPGRVCSSQQLFVVPPVCICVFDFVVTSMESMCLLP